MIRRFSAITALAILAAPTAGLANTATLRLTLTVPVRCTLDVISGSVIDSSLVLQVHRSCNTSHEVILSGLQDAELGKISVNYNGESEVLSGASLSLLQTERYYDQTDNVIITAANGNRDDMLRLAGALQLSVNVV